MQTRDIAGNAPYELTLHVKYITIIIKFQEEQPSWWCDSGFRSTGLRRHGISPAQALAGTGPRRRMAPRASKTAAADTAGVGSAGRRCPSAHRPSARRPAPAYPSIPSASTQRVSSSRIAMCCGHARSQAPQPMHSLARLCPCPPTSQPSWCRAAALSP